MRLCLIEVERKSKRRLEAIQRLKSAMPFRGDGRSLCCVHSRKGDTGQEIEPRQGRILLPKVRVDFHATDVGQGSLFRLCAEVFRPASIASHRSPEHGTARCGDPTPPSSKP